MFVLATSARTLTRDTTPFDKVYAWIFQANPVEDRAGIWEDRSLDDLSNSSESVWIRIAMERESASWMLKTTGTF